MRASPSGGVVELFSSGLSSWTTLTFGFGDDLYLPNNLGIIRVDASLLISTFVPAQSSMLGVQSLRYAPSSPYGPALFGADNNGHAVWRIDENGNVNAFSEAVSWRPRSLAFGTGGKFGFGLYMGSWVTPSAVFSLAPDGTATAFATGFLREVEDIVFGKGNAFRRDMYIAQRSGRRIIRIGPIRSSDCDANGILDECDIAQDTNLDCNANGRLDLCELAESSVADCNSNGIPDECEWPPAQPPTPERPAFSKNRFLSFVPDSVPSITALRVTFVDLPQPFDLFNGQTMWVGPERLVNESGAEVEPVPGTASFTAAPLRCTPFFQDWSHVGLIHVFNEFVVPGGSFDVCAISEGCDLGTESSFSAPLSLSTAVYGDTVTDLGQVPPGPPDGSVNVVDALAVLGRFGSVTGSISKARADLEPGCLDLKINVSDVLASLSGFSGLSYPFPPTSQDPCASTCTSPLP